MPITKKNRIKIRKVIALFLLFTFLNQAFAPSVAYALTAGPTAPEATNFEPIDTTDMVNPLTGDFTYNLPLLEVPGPEGGYPLSLSYHAAIQPNEDASWVGLGWSLNPGAIARNVNGYADDWQNQSATTGSYWSGGTTKTLSVNVGLTIEAASVSVGLSFAQDTYKGFGVGFSAGVGVGTAIPGLRLGVSVGVSAFGEPYAGLDVSYSHGMLGSEFLKGSANLGIGTNFKTINAGFSGGISAGSKDKEGNSFSTSLLGASISTSDSHVSLRVGDGGAITANNANAGRIQTQSDGWGFSLPLPVVSISVSYTTVRYWSDESAGVAVNGVLYNHSSINSISDMNTVADDNYQLLDYQNNNIIDSPDPATQVGGTYPDFDDYSVTAQGLSGYMRPYNFATVLFNQNRINNNDHTKDIYAEVRGKYGAMNSGWQFRFINDFSNYYGQSSPWQSDIYYSFDQTPQYGNNDGTYGYSSAKNRLEGSKHIEYFTNDQIISGTAAARGFIDCASQTAGFTRMTGSQIGGFMITNASGVTYHYALPVYSSGENVYTQKIDQSNGTFANSLVKSTPYAYTWYLTAITGPDYVSRGTQGTISQNDWGYWVKFDYGEWSKTFRWRNPSEGFNIDLDSQYKTYSSGVKEIYYLDAIETRTHTAIFQKELRADGKSYLNDGSGNIKFYVQGSEVCANDGRTGCTPSFYYPIPTLRLKNILLFQNDQLPIPVNTLRSYGSGPYTGNFTFSAQTSNPDGSHNAVNVRVFDANNVIDNFDLDAASMTHACLRRIVFDYDYSLCPGTPNSSDPTGTAYTSSPSTNAPATLGKLTLLSVDFQGRGGSGTHITPPIQFQYDLDPTDTNNQNNIKITALSGLNGILQTQSSNNYKVGDIVSFTVSGTKYYCTLLSAIDNIYYSVLFLNVAPPLNINTIYASVRTKNPPYNKDGSDVWGCYKSDYVSSSNENLSRMTTPVSNKSTDVWSLRKIISSVGANININYEGDTYNKSVMNSKRSLIINSTIRTSTQNYILYTSNGNLDLTTIFKPGDRLGTVLLKQINQSFFGGLSVNTYKAISTDSYANPAIITALTQNTISISVDPAMDADIISVPPLSGTVTTSIIAGNVISNGSNYFYGGGLRVKDVIVDDLNGHINKTSYNYSIPGYAVGQASSSGLTSYEPGVFDADNVDQFGTTAATTYRKELYKYYNQILSIARELPAPGITYEYVAVADSTILPNGQVIPIEGKTVYQYEVFKPEMIGISQTYSRQNIGINGTEPAGGTGTSYYITTYSKKNMAIKDYTSRIGNLKRLITYDNSGNKITEKINHFLHDDLGNTSFQNQVTNYEPRLTTYNGVAYNNMGVIKERYGNARMPVATVDNSSTHNPTGYNDLLVMSNKETFPAIQTGVTQIDYKNGTKMDQQNLAYDFYTGAITKTLTIDAYGNRFINQVTPAYTAGNGSSLAYPAMGLKTHDDESGATQHKQMLTQQASNYTFSVDASNNPVGVVTATVQTWSNSVPVLDPDGAINSATQTNIWRMEKNYAFLAPGSSANNVIPYTSFVDYYATGGSSNPSWKKTAQITQYNVYSNALEATDINNNYAATRMGYKSSKVLVTGGPAQYNEIAYAGAEDALLGTGNFSSNISPGSGTVVSDTTKSHTGTNSLMVAGGSNGFTYSVPLSQLSTVRKNYSVAVWVKPPSPSNISQATLYYQVNGGTIVTPTQAYTKIAAGWYLLEMTVPSSAITGSTGNLVVGCKNGAGATLYFDDFRFQPTSASTTAYVYNNQTGELNYILGNNNLYVRYQYDDIGRLVRTYKEVLGKSNIPLINAIRYHYARNGGNGY